MSVFRKRWTSGLPPPSRSGRAASTTSAWKLASPRTRRLRGQGVALPLFAAEPGGVPPAGNRRMVTGRAAAVAPRTQPVGNRFVLDNPPFVEIAEPRRDLVDLPALRLHVRRNGLGGEERLRTTRPLREGLETLFGLHVDPNRECRGHDPSRRCRQCIHVSAVDPEGTVLPRPPRHPGRRGTADAVRGTPPPRSGPPVPDPAVRAWPSGAPTRAQSDRA